MRIVVFSIFCLLLLSTLPVDAGEEPAEEEPKLVPLPETVPVPEENPSTPAKIVLGKQLFFDPRLSGNNTTSCATCHIPEKAFADGEKTSRGHGGKRLARNTPGLLNVAFLSNCKWDGGAKSLEEQALEPITSPEEMNQDLDELEAELNAVPGYVRQFQEVFRSKATRENIAKALASFERTLVSRDSPFDRYLRGDETALSRRARFGLELFRGEAGCLRCHHGPLLSDGKYYRLGVEFRDKGRENVTGKKADRYRFRTSPLRDIAATGPYMHDGSMRTLEEVVFFYLRTVPTRTPEGMPLDVKPVQAVSLNEIDALVEFLKSLSGEPVKVTPPELP